MKLLFDQNLAPSLVQRLSDISPVQIMYFFAVWMKVLIVR